MSQNTFMAALCFVLGQLLLVSRVVDATSLVAVAEAEDPQLLVRLTAEVEQALEGTLTDKAKERLDELSDALSQNFEALPKNAYGNLDHSTVRYALNRMFVQRHGWVIRGFQSEGFDNSSTDVLNGRVPALVQELFESRVGTRGSSLNEVAALASLLEYLIEKDMASKFRAILQFHGEQVDMDIDATKAREYINLAMMLTITGHGEIKKFEKKQLDLFVKHFPTLYPPWPQTLRMLDNVVKALLPEKTSFNFQDMLRIIREANTRFYKTVHQQQCQDTRNMLLEAEDRQSGRVKLLDFYNKALNENQYQFTETVDYLRDNGMLDESDEAMPRIIVANYVSGQANCVARTMYHAVCCPDECESYLSQFERELGRPEATPEEILAAEAAEGRRPSDVMIERLHQIADHHKGVVPLHGRLFAQWMHFVRPKTCAYPHISGTTYTKTTEEWEADTGLFAGSTMEEMREQTDLLASTAADAWGSEQDVWHEVASTMWSMQEELVVNRADGLVKKDSASAKKSSWRTSVASVGKRLPGLSKGGVMLAVGGSSLAYVMYGGDAKDGKSQGPFAALQNLQMPAMSGTGSAYRSEPVVHSL